MSTSCRTAMGHFWSHFTRIYRRFIGLFVYSKYAHQQPSALIEDLDSALHILKDKSLPERPIAYLQFVDGILSRVIQEIEKNSAYKAAWMDTGDHIESLRVMLAEFYQYLERTKHKELPDPFPVFLLQLFIDLHFLATTLQECGTITNAFNHMLLGRKISRQISKCCAEIEGSSSLLKKTLTPELILDMPLDELVKFDGMPLLDISKMATPRRFRLVECASLIEHGMLRLLEFIYFPSVSYSAISYVWRGNNVPGDFSSPVFVVRGAEDADPIGIDVLHDACIASLKRDAPYLWVDRLCLMQTSKEDKNWQIRKMYDMYRFCSLCLVIPGGLRRLVSLQEETNWIHRGWTLQEALAPPAVEVLFLWNLGDARASVAGDGKSSAWIGDITEIGKGRSAMAPLWLVIDSCVDGGLALRTPESILQGRVSGIRLFGVGSKGYTGTTDFRFALPNVAALAAAVSQSMQADHDRKCYTIWKCALMRTSSRPVDMVFSIMGLFDVSLDTSKFDVHDRVGATIALTREILRKGGRANWLGVAFHAPPCPRLSTFPNFPRTAVGGKALVRVSGGVGGACDRGKYVEISKLMDNEYPIAEVLGPMPHGSMDEDGYFTFEAKSVRIARSSQVPSWTSSIENQAQRFIAPWDARPSTSKFKQIPGTNGEIWDVVEELTMKQDGEPPPPSADPLSTQSPDPEWQPHAYAVLLGCFFGYSPMFTPAYDCNNVRGLIIEEHLPGKFGVVSYFTLSIKTIDWVVGWSTGVFCIGGPERGVGLGYKESKRDESGPEAGDSEEEDSTEREQRPLLQPPDTKVTFANIQSEHIVAIARAAHTAERKQ